MGERELIQAIADGDARAAATFVNRYLPAVLSAFRFKKVPEQDVEDLVQDFFAHLAEDSYRRLRSWRGASSLSTWLIAVAKNFAIDWFRRRRVMESIDESQLLPCEEQADSPERLQCLREQRRLIDGILEQQMDGRPAELLRRRYRQQQTVREIATELDLSETNVRVAIHRAQAMLRKYLQQAGLFELGET